ncbi:DUF4012 domain-containing protein [Bifidobacterium sp. SMB2]|uniref:DUF4012 domain-containing protein n=1 Tax=Bifidobacterium saimiriisciurei TaxID=2661627 RepID=A0ABX0CB67_9BIFI|nr:MULTISPECIES: DUF4012 domain-containing protein [Bifidobacterium]NEG95352.1 DUF4012 domain-containing protein [Bifidobacterium sp. SMB2]NEH11464.1 DUF4012 domain-containing protein [Bifidobacterium saimiriisciurei]
MRNESNGVADDMTAHDDERTALGTSDDVVQPNLDGFSKDALADVTQGARPRRRRMSAEHVARIRRRKRIRRVLLVMLLIMAAIGAFGAYMGYSALQVKRAVAEASQGAAAIPAAIRSGDVGAAQSGMTRLSNGVDKAYAQTSGLGWRMLGALPVIGDDVTAVRDTVSIMHDVSVNALPQLSRAAGNLSVKSVSVNDGTVSMPGLAESADDLDQANGVIGDAEINLGRVPTPHIAQIADALDNARGKFAELADQVDVYARIANVAPSMLDLDDSGARTYLVIAQNNAEVRPTGGLPGSWGTLTVDGGRFTLSDFVSESTLPQLDSPVLDAQDDEIALFGENLLTKPHDVNFTPDYPRAAAIAKAMWEKSRNQTISGVIMIDPCLLQSLLAVTGGVTIDDAAASDGSGAVTLNGSNTAQYLLHDSYLENRTPDEQDAVFSAVARQSFDHILHAANGGNSAALLNAVMTSTRQGHLKVWSVRAAEQERLHDTAIAGELETKPVEPNTGVYFSDGTQGKMSWYLDRSVTSRRTRTLESGAQQYAVDVKLTNTVNAADVAGLPDYVTGKGMSEGYDVNPGEIETVVYVYAPAGGRLVDWTISGGTGGSGSGGSDSGGSGSGGKGFDTITTHNGLTVGVKKITLKPGETATLSVTVQTSERAAGTTMTIHQTPLIKENDQ